MTAKLISHDCISKTEKVKTPERMKKTLLKNISYSCLKTSCEGQKLFMVCMFASF